MELKDITKLDRALMPSERRMLHGKAPQDRGHAAPPGTGPEGETCGSCKHLYRKHMSKTYLKCRLISQYWTGGGATDVRAKDLACKLWEKP